jgi:hypothetical protein
MMLISMKPMFLFSICLFCCLLSPALAADAQMPQSPHDLMKDVIYNELKDRQHESFWQYHIQKRMGPSTFTAIQIETKDGPLSRILTRDGKPLTADQKRIEDERVAKLVKNPAELARLKQSHDQDEQRLMRLMKLMSGAFLYEYDGSDGGFMRLKFKPNPSFSPPTYEARIFHSLGGTIWVDPAQKRLARLQGVILDRVDFGYGLLGHVEKGGTFEIRRQPVAENHWRTSRIDVHVVGRVIFFKTINKDQSETRSDFKPVPSETTLQEASKLLSQPEQSS